MKILFLCNKSPWPTKEGGPIAMNQLIQGLAEEGHTVWVLAVNSKKFNVNPLLVPDEYRKKINIEWVDVDLSIKPISAFYHLFSKKSYHVDRFIAKSFQTKLVNILSNQSFDIVQLETLFMTPYISLIKKYSTAKIVLRAHNIEHLIWQRIYRLSTHPLKKLYLKKLYKTLRQYELNILKEPDALLPISEKDAQFFSNHTTIPIKTIPFGIDLPTINVELEPENALYYIGAMNWMPNAEGVRWFIKEVWPRLTEKHKAIKLYLAGREMPRWMRQIEEKNIIVLGEVSDAAEFIKSKNICIAPLFSGSGIRIKIIESMALGKAVVSTSIGAEGIDVEDSFNISLADSAEEFARAISFLYENPDQAKIMGGNARKLIAEKHNNKEIIESLQCFYKEIL